MIDPHQVMKEHTPSSKLKHIKEIVIVLEGVLQQRRERERREIFKRETITN